MLMPVREGPSRGAPKPSVGPRCQFCRQPAAPEQKFCGACGAILAARCERKQATVLFFDVCGFTAMSERLDPEDVRAIIERAFDVILESIHAHGGTVNQFLGDGIMALFSDIDGAEDQAIRALQAAVAIQADLVAIRTDVRRVYDVDFRIRAGVHSGPVTVGVIGRGLRNDYVAQGETISIAARLLALARPGGIAISSRTRELVGDAFLFDDVGEISTAGAHAWAVTSDPNERIDRMALAEV